MKPETKKDLEKFKIVDEKYNETYEFEVYADSPKTIITVPWDPKRREREHKSYVKFLELIKRKEEEKTKISKEIKDEGHILRKVIKSNK